MFLQRLTNWNVEDFSTGDNWDEPFVSGFDNLWEKIVLDMDATPHAYEAWEFELFNMESTQMTTRQMNAVTSYMSDWISSRYV